MNPKYHFLIIIISITHLFSCTQPRYIYSASTPNNPYFKQKGDSKLAAYYAGETPNVNNKSNFNQGVDLQSAYAVTNHFALTFDFYKRWEKDFYNTTYVPSYDSSIVGYKRDLTSLGAGYFFFLDKNKEITFNVYGGIGLGNFTIHDNTIDPSGYNFYKSNLTKWYLQPSFNFIINKYIYISYILKFSLVHYYNVATSYSGDELADYNLNSLPNSTLLFKENTVAFQFLLSKPDCLRIETSFTIVSNAPEGYADRRATNASLGLVCDLSKIHYKKK